MTADKRRAKAAGSGTASPSTICAPIQQQERRIIEGCSVQSVQTQDVSGIDLQHFADGHGGAVAMLFEHARQSNTH